MSGKIYCSHYISPLLPFWTSSCLLPASTSNPPRFSFPFGLHHALSPLQRPICHASASLLDFISPSPRFNIQSATLRLPFWTSLCLPYTLKSTPSPDEPATSGAASDIWRRLRSNRWRVDSVSFRPLENACT